MPDTILDVANLGVGFGSGRSAVMVVDDTSFTIARGEAFGLIGESGCGKSTILRAVAGLIEPREGAIHFNGRPVAGKRDRSFFRSVQMVFQDPYGSLHPRKMIQNVLRESVGLMGLDNPDQRVDQALTDVGLGPEFRYRYPHALSGGQRQRVAIARALIVEPVMLLLDEPTSALDVSVQAEILNLLKRLRSERGLSYLMVSHDIAVIAHMCERTAIMKDGRILEELTSHQLRQGDVTNPYTREFLAASAPAIKRQADA